MHNACQAVIDRDGFTGSYRKRTGYSIGISFAPDWGEGNILGLYHDIDVPLEPGMVFHVPVALREWGKFTVAVSETVAGDQRRRAPARQAQARDAAGVRWRPLPEPDIALAARLFDTLGKKTRDIVGFTRASYGEGEQFAHDLIARDGARAGLAVTTDVAGNLYVTLEGPRSGTRAHS